MPKTVKIFCMGDSLTEGDGNPSAYRYSLFEKLWKAGVSFRFIGPSTSRDDVRLPPAYRHHAGNCGYEIGDEGKNGGSMLNNLKKTDYADSISHADIVLLWIGTNDYGHKYDLEHICERYEKLLDTIWNYSPYASVYGASMLRSHNGETDLDKWMRDTAPGLCRDKGHKFTYVDLNREGFALSGEQGDFPEDDGHPNEQGNQKIARTWFDYIIDEVRQISSDGKDYRYEPYIKAEKLQLYTKEASVALDASFTVSARVLPEDATVRTLVFESSDPETVRVDRYGRAFPKKEGSACIKVTALDGGFSDVCRIKVVKPQNLIQGMTEVYRSDFTNKDGFTGDTEFIREKFGKFRVPYKAKPLAVSAKNFEFDADRFILEFTHQTANHSTRNKNNYSSVKLGGFELRICGLASYVCLYENGVLTGAYRNIPIAAMDDRYLLKCENGRACVYRNGEKLFESLVKERRVHGTLTVCWQEIGAKSEIKDIRIYK